MEKLTTEERKTDETYKKARLNKMREEHGESMERLHAIPFSRNVCKEIADVTHEYATKVARLVST